MSSKCGWSSKCEQSGCVKAEPVLEKTLLAATGASGGRATAPQVVCGDFVTVASGGSHGGLRPQSSVVVAGCDDGVVYVHQAQSGGRVLKLQGHGGVVTSVAVAPLSGTRIASASADKTVRVWENSNRGDFALIKGSHTGTVRSVAWSPDERLLLTASDDKTVKLFEAPVACAGAGAGAGRGYRFLGSLTGHVNWVRSAAFLGAGEAVASGGDDKSVRVFDVASRKAVVAFFEHEDRVNAVQGLPGTSSGAAVLGSVGADGNFCIFDTREHSQPLVQCYKAAHNGAAVTSLSFHPHGGFYALTCGKDGLARLWDLREGRALWTLQATNAAGTGATGISVSAFNFAMFDRETGARFLVGAADGLLHKFLANVADEPLLGGKENCRNAAGRATIRKAAVATPSPPSPGHTQTLTLTQTRTREPRPETPQTPQSAARSESQSPAKGLLRGGAQLETVIALLERLETRISKLEERMAAAERLRE